MSENKTNDEKTFTLFGKTFKTKDAIKLLFALVILIALYGVVTNFDTIKQSIHLCVNSNTKEASALPNVKLDSMPKDIYWDFSKI